MKTYHICISENGTDAATHLPSQASSLRVAINRAVWAHERAIHRALRVVIVSAHLADEKPKSCALCMYRAAQ